MSLFNEIKEREFTAVGFKNQRRNLRELKQVGTSNKKRDEERKALMPGKRISKAGNIYWETRRSRSDKADSNI